MNNSANVAKLIKERMKSCGISNKQLSENIDNVNVNTIAQLAKGREISYVTFAKIADYLDCSVDYLLGRTDAPTSTYSISNTNTTVNGTQANVINNANNSDSLTEQFLQAFDKLSFEEKLNVMQYVNDIKKAPSENDDVKE